MKIDPAVVQDGDVELIEDLVCAGVREALRKTGEIKRERILKALPFGGMGLQLPDLL